MPSVGASKLMRLLFRMIFWLTLVLVLLPSVRSQTTSSGLVSAGDAASAAKATVTDLRSFCQRQPEACTVGSQAAALIGHRAQAGAKMLYEYLTEHFGEGESGTPATAGNGNSLAQTAGRPGRDTLLPADLAPAWRGPRPRNEARLDRS
jgi:predicted secreted protein